MAITHATTADGTFSGSGSTAWNEAHSVNVTGVLKGSSGDIVAAVAGTDFASPQTCLAMGIAMQARISPL